MAGLSSLHAAWKGGDEGNKERALEDERAYDKQTRAAGLSTLDDHTAAQREQFKLSAAQSSAGLDMLPGKTANALRQQELDKGSLDFKVEQQPIEQANTAKQTTIAGAGFDMAVSNIPAAQQANDAKNRDAFTAQHINDFAQFGRLIQMGDKAGAMVHAQSVSDAEAKRTGTPLKKLVDIRLTGQKIAAGDDRAYNFIYEDGSEVPIPNTAIASSMSALKTGKYSMKQGRAGDVQVLNENTGEVQTKVAADPNYARSAGTNQHTPAQLQLVNAYMEAPENKGMTFSQAMDRVKTSMEKPRHQAILEFAGKDLMALKDPQGAVEKWTKLYDDIKGVQNPVPRASELSSNSPAAPTIDPKYQNLFIP